jgi:hypothetical protein
MIQNNNLIKRIIAYSAKKIKANPPPPYSTLNPETREQTALQSALIQHTVLYCTESGDTRCCDNRVCPPDNGHVDARNMSRIVM